MTVIGWLLDSDPSIRWQVMRDLMGAPAEQVTAERARVATEGLGVRLLCAPGVCLRNFTMSSSVTPPRAGGH